MSTQLGSLRQVIDRVSAALLAEPKGLDLSQLPAARRALVHAHFDAACLRLDAAKQLRETDKHLAAILLFRAGLEWLAQAYLAFRDDADEGPSESGPALFARFVSRLAQDDGAIAAQLEGAIADTTTTVTTELDALGAGELEQRCDALYWAIQPLMLRLTPTTPRERNLASAWPRISIGVTLLALCIPSLLFTFRARNVALHKRTTASSAEFGTQPSDVVDGKNFGGFGYHSAEEESPWLRVDLGRSYKVREVRVFARHDCCLDQSVPMAIETSTDGEQYVAVAQRDEPFDQVDPWTITPRGISARYIRVRVLRLAVLVLSEIEVIGEPVN